MENNISTKGTNQTNFKNGDIVVFGNSIVLLKNIETNLRLNIIQFLM